MTIELERKDFDAKGSTIHPCTYWLSEYPVKNGKWYRVEFLDWTIKFHRFKNYRSYNQAKQQFDEQVNLEEWRQNR